MAICGDGSTSNGRWHESLNMSAIYSLPVVWVVNNNQYAYSTPNPLEFPVPTIAERAAAYGMPGVRVDAQDVLEVYAARARRGRARPRRRRADADRDRSRSGGAATPVTTRRSTCPKELLERVHGARRTR